MNTKLIPIGLAAVIALATASALHAAPPMHGSRGDCGGPHAHGKFEGFDAEHLPPFLKQLSLSEAQRTKIGEILKTEGPALRDRFRGGKERHEMLRKLAFSTDYTEEKAKALSEEGAKSMAEAAQAHARTDHAIFQLLTPDQQRQVSEWANRERGNFSPRP